MRNLSTAAVAGALLLCGLVACSEPPPDPGPRFETEPGELTCMKHQPQPPGPRYTDAAQRRTDDTLALLRYYTANGAKPYCDGKPAEHTDTEWITLYVALTSEGSPGSR